MSAKLYIKVAFSYVTFPIPSVAYWQLNSAENQTFNGIPLTIGIINSIASSSTQGLINTERNFETAVAMYGTSVLASSSSAPVTNPLELTGIGGGYLQPPPVNEEGIKGTIVDSFLATNDPIADAARASNINIPQISASWNSGGYTENFTINSYYWTTVDAPASLVISPVDANKSANSQLSSVEQLAEPSSSTPITTNYTFSVVRTGDLSTPEIVYYTIVGSGANPATPSDFTAPTGFFILSAGQASQSLTLSLGGHVTASAPNMGFAVDLSSADYGSASAPGNIQGIPKPDVSTLADLANAAYSPSVVSIDGYVQNTSLRMTDAVVNFNGEAFQDGDQVVVSLRGTEITSLPDLIADASWISASAPNSTLLQYISDAAGLIQDVKLAYPRAGITITGHSLGGAIAEILGYATDLPAITFNAPGMAQWETNQAVLQLLKLAGTSNTVSPQTVNYRIRGDQVSLAGRQVGQTETLPSQYNDNWVTALLNHFMTTVFHNVLQPATPGIPDAALPGLTLIVPVIAPDGITRFIPTTSVQPNEFYVTDPSGASTFAVSASSNSAPFDTITLPEFAGINEYALGFELGSQLISSQVVQGGVTVTAPGGATGFSFTALGTIGSPAVMPNQGNIGFTFASAGTFSGSISPEANSVQISPASIGVYRFWDSIDGTHFFTSSSSERDNIMATRPDLVDEGVGLNAIDPTSLDPNGNPVYRFFSSTDGTHFFTASASERDNVVTTRSDLIFEGTGFYEHATQQAGDTPIYRFFDTKFGTHLYVSDSNERANILATRSDLTPEGIAFYAPAATT